MSRPGGSRHKWGWGVIVQSLLCEPSDMGEDVVGALGPDVGSGVVVVSVE